MRSKLECVTTMPSHSPEAKQILPKARQSLTLSEEAYQAGEFAFLQVLIAWRPLHAVDARRRLDQTSALTDGMLLSGGISESLIWQRMTICEVKHWDQK